MPSSPALAALRASLPSAISTTLTSGSELAEAARGARARHEVLPTTIPLLDRPLGGGLPRGALVELDGGVSSGRFSLVLATLAAATGSGESAALVDLGDHLDPQAARAARVDLPRLLWVRPRTTRQALAAAEIVLAAGFALVVLDLGLALRGRRPNDASWIRLSRAAAAHRGALLVSSPYRITGVAARAALRVGRGRPMSRSWSVAPYGRLLLGLEASGAAGTVRLHAIGVPGGLESVSVAPAATAVKPGKPATPTAPLLDRTTRRSLPAPERRLLPPRAPRPAIPQEPGWQPVPFATIASLPSIASLASIPAPSPGSLGAGG